MKQASEGFEEISLNIQWSEGFVLISVYTSPGEVLTEVIKAHFELEVVSPQTATEGLGCVNLLYTPHQRTNGVILDTSLLSQSEFLTLVSALNMGREALVSDFPYPLFLCIPGGQKVNMRELAPDLMAINSYILSSSEFL